MFDISSITQVDWYGDADWFLETPFKWSIGNTCNLSVHAYQS